MQEELNPLECRILGSLIEKEITTPEYYPLSLNALVLACNQKSNREPVMELSESDVMTALDSLKVRHLIWERRSQGSRVLKYEHNCAGKWRFSGAEVAVVAELLLRGPQTPGELRSRGARMHPFADLNEVDAALASLQSREGGPFVIELGRRPGAREVRFAHLFSGKPGEDIPASNAPASQPSAGRTKTPDLSERVAQLEQEVAALKEQLAVLIGGSATGPAGT